MEKRMTGIEESTDLRDRSDSDSSLSGETESKSDLNKLSSTLDSIGYGFFHIILTLVSGWALASDSVEILCISFISPAAEHDLYLSKKKEGWLDASIFIGMMIGGYFWGGWADAVGRRTCLLNSLMLNGCAGLVSAFMPSYGWFLTFRIFSGIGVGGSIPVIFSYFSEFFSNKKRGPFIVILSMFWTVGQVYTALLAWLVIPRGCIEFRLFGLDFHNWRVFAMLCTIPSLSSALFLFLLPESPSFLLLMKKQKRLSKALSTVSRINSLCYGRRKPAGSFIEIDISKEEEHLSFSKRGGTLDSTVKGALRDAGMKVVYIFNTTKKLFSKEFIRRTVVLVIIMFTLSYGYYGLQLWFPEYFKHVIDENKPKNSTDDDDYNNCTNTDVKPYKDSLYEATASVPGNFLGVVVINIIGGKLLLTGSMLTSGISVFFIWWVKATEDVVIILSCVFNGVSIAGWNALNVLNASSFPTELRSTAMGFQAAVGRIAAIGGIVTFGSFYNSSPTLPILIVAVCLFTGGICTMALPAVSKADKHNFIVRGTNRLCSCVIVNVFGINKPYRSSYTKL
ncbi:synaptic vesicle glycoprotein 2C-like [Dysidea avara]|uniref:synaptic vesicle glycoprotein 2C-like n=1 Tax=Dysidea avara TaxID=196820 RepID=UPI0033179E22